MTEPFSIKNTHDGANTITVTVIYKDLDHIYSSNNNAFTGSCASRNKFEKKITNLCNSEAFLYVSKDGVNYEKLKFEYLNPEYGFFHKLQSNIDMQKGETVYVAFDKTLNPSSWKITINGSEAHEVQGDISVLYYGPGRLDEPVAEDQAYMNLFYRDTMLMSAEKLVLPALTLDAKSYEGMFHGCINLRHAPAINAQRLGEECCLRMFSDCEQLEKTPELPAMDLAKFCYQHMFYRCSKLETTPELPAEKAYEGCYYSMFSCCSHLKHAKPIHVKEFMVWVNVTQTSFLSEMFFNCNELENVPEMNHDDIAKMIGLLLDKNHTRTIVMNNGEINFMILKSILKSIFNHMFYGCEKIKTDLAPFFL